MEMKQIRSLFDPIKGIQRSIETVISYQASQEERLKSEIDEYIVTDSIERQLERLLENIQTAMEAGGSHEIGVWVSGFYGSGKSSFTKYLGFAFDQSVQIDGRPFLRHLQDRLQKPQTKALLAAVAARFPAAVVMLDLASEQIAGATMAEVSTVLYYKVLQYAGYSRNLKVAALERKLRVDGRLHELEALFEEGTGQAWKDYKNDPLVVDSLIPRIAHQLYPTLFRSEQAFSTESSDVVYLMDDRVKEMIDVVREVSGKEQVVFVIDEIGQYVGGSQGKILDLQGLAENLKNIGQGKVWIVGTAQQTLTEDDPRSAINSPQLFKLKDRFPISVDLESSDIREICYRRLLGKSSAGETALGMLFDRHGQALRHNTRLVDAKFYDSSFDRKSFIDLYPFLPAHFDIVLHLLGALAKSTGGIGLRSAIKVVQDILIEQTGGRPPVADHQVGWLATTVTLYDALEKDIRRAFPSVHQAVERVRIAFSDEQRTQDVAKTIAVLQILGNMPVTAKNVASLMHPAVDAASMADTVTQAIEAMRKHSAVPLGEKDGGLRFFSEKLNEVEQERVQVALRAADQRRLLNEALRDAFDPLPSARLNGSLMVTSGLRHSLGGQTMTLAGERETVQTVVAFIDPADYEAERTRLLADSRHKSSQNTIFLLGRTADGADELTAEIYRCNRIVELHRNDPDQEVKEYCASQLEQAAKLSTELKQLLTRSLAQGSFLFRGSSIAVNAPDQSLAAACRKHLGTAAEQIFDRYAEAAERASTDLAEKFLRAAGGNLRAVSSQLDPLGLVQVSGGTPSIKAGHKALVSIRDYVERAGTVEGKRLLEAFAGPPFGWSPDTTRYLIAALLVAGEIKLKVAGREVTVNGQQAIDALKTNNSFRPIGVALRHDRPSMDVLARAAVRVPMRRAVVEKDASEDDDEAGDGQIGIDQTDGLLSWAVGISFGRFDWRLATGEREAPPEPDPFDPLPAKSPGMLPDGAAPFHAHDGILADDQGHPHDLPRLIEEVLARVQVDVPSDLRRWLQRDFFPLHLKQYSKSRRKAPIYWPLSTSSGSYTLWLYYPSLTSQTLYTAVNDFIEGPNGKLQQVGRQLVALRDKGTARSRDDEKAFEALQTLELELIELRDTLLQIAPTYRPNHDDGVQITAAPLWPLFRHKPWQKVLKDTWAKLEKGDYDWAHLAMAYWPDRVREKCKTDKSLAIAHDLEQPYVEPAPKATKPRGRKRKEAGE